MDCRFWTTLSLLLDLQFFYTPAAVSWCLVGSLRCDAIYIIRCDCSAANAYAIDVGVRAFGRKKKLNYLQVRDSICVCVPVRPSVWVLRQQYLPVGFVGKTRISQRKKHRIIQTIKNEFKCY